MERRPSDGQTDNHVMAYHAGITIIVTVWLKRFSCRFLEKLSKFSVKNRQVTTGGGRSVSGTQSSFFSLGVNTVRMLR